MACYICVLIGNFKTAAALTTLGSSTAGWSKVGLGLARSFEAELDEAMYNASEKLVSALEQLLDVQDMLDTTVSMIGNTTDEAVGNGAQLFLLQQSSTSGDIVGNTSNSSLDPLVDFLTPVVKQAVDGVVKAAVDKLNEYLTKFLEIIRPTLLQIGEWIIKFGDTIQGSIDAFTTSLDKVQKVFDQIMSQMSGTGEGAEGMLHETYTLFDVSQTGVVSIQDLRNVASLYSISALQGTKPEELVEKYDADGDRQLNREEMAEMVEDDSVPNIMSTVLRTYARKLSEVAGNVAAGVMRDEVALSVVQYFQLVCAKNQTKVGWVSDALGNGSLIIDFTSAVMAELCLQDGSPESLTTANIGLMVIDRMYDLHPKRTVEAVQLLGNTTWWVTNGFSSLDQSRCVTKVTGWLVEAESTGENVTSLLGVESAEAAGERVRRTAAAHMLEARQASSARRSSLFVSKTSQVLLSHLTGGSAATGSSSSSLASQVINAGQPAVPSTLLFADWLSANATATADRFQDMSFDYSSQSSSTLDSFATQITSMANKMKSFIQMMEGYATPAGISRLESTVQKFLQSTEADITRIIETKIGDIVDQLGPTLDSALDTAEQEASDRIGDLVGTLVGDPITAAIDGPLGDAISDVLGNPDMGDQMGDFVGSSVGGIIANTTSDYVSKQIRTVIDGLVDKAVSGISNALPTAGETGEASLLDIRSTSGVKLERLDFDLSGAWETLVTTMGTLNSIIPVAIECLKDARTEVSKAASNMVSIFGIFEEKGPETFNLIAFFWKMLWVLYFCFLAPLTLINLFYAFWASGFFGGPQPSPEVDGAEPPKSWRERMGVCCNTCGVCMTYCHDTQCCFWSVVILMQVIALVIFVVSIVLCLLAGIKAFISAGCAEIYILGDNTVCTASLQTLKSFVGTFFVADALELLNGICYEHDLMACTLITAKMKTSAILTTVFSFLATILSLQIVIESAVMHEQARYRRLMNKMLMDEEEKEQSTPVA
eukprot:CAMPEP_0179047084 /NCGR_PEP_ID=MMETSP0796-20121207/19017_1 /TAXON_ID=73915 /ORGANISM="Pyrodinium bahamense, Strain pbaha01" /LENGTH=997 /DNA_ID=CAMNT_0020743523 /DNA_START=81 /DNA_END=3074 /DNA_ORIENTATION=+